MQPAADCFTCIREGFARVRRSDPAWSLPGLPALELPLNPVLHAEDLLWFETQHGVRLPEAYRTFLCEIGNGGGRAGLDALGAHVGEGPGCLPDEALSRPCLLGPQLPAPVWASLAAQLQAAPGEQARKAALIRVFAGLLPVAGPAAEGLPCVVLNGPYAGRVASIDLQGRCAPRFAVEPDFLAWYWRSRAPACLR